MGQTPNFFQVAVDYASDVLEGRIVAGRWMKKACRRFTIMLERAANPHNSYRFSVEEVQKAGEWISKLPHVEGKWATATITLEPWQVFVIAACVGFRRRIDGYRLVSVVFFQVARKSAKTTLVVALVMYVVAVEGAPGALAIFGATTGAQARIAFSIAQRMVQRSSWLRSLGFTAWANAITYEPTGASLRPVNSRSSTQDGLNPSVVVLDESHAQDHRLHDVLKSAMGARPDGLLIAPTTAGYDLTSVGYNLRLTSMKILDGVIESEHTFCALFELDEEDDWRDEKVWIKAAPMLGVTPTLDYVRKYCLDAIQTPSLQAEFQTKLCNRWLQSAKTWLDMRYWDRCADRTLTLEQFRGARCWIAGDLAERDDLAALALLFERAGIVYAFIRCYLPRDVVDERSRHTPEYRVWADSGVLVLTDGNLVDFALIERDVRTFCQQFDVQEIVLERFGALNMAANLSNSGLPARIETKNARVFTPPARDLEARLKAGKFRHDGNSLFKWCASNTAVHRRADDSLLPLKAGGPESKDKIDAIDATLLALGAMLQAPAPVEYRILAL